MHTASLESLSQGQELKPEIICKASVDAWEVQVVDLQPHEFSAFAQGIAEVAYKRERHPNDFQRFQVPMGLRCSLPSPQA